MPHGPGLFARTFGKKAEELPVERDSDQEPDQRAGVLATSRQRQLSWDEAKPDPRPKLAHSLEAADEPQGGAQQQREQPAIPIKAKKKSAFKQLFAKWKQQLGQPSSQPSTAGKVSSSAPPAPGTPVHDTQQPQQEHSRHNGAAAAQIFSAVNRSGSDLPAAGASAHRSGSSPHHTESSTSKGSTPAHSHALFTQTAASAVPGSTFMAPSYLLSTGPTASKVGLTHHAALPIPDPDSRALHHIPSRAAQQPPKKQQPHSIKPAASLEAQIERLISVEPPAGNQLAAAGSLPWSGSMSSGTASGAQLPIAQHVAGSQMLRATSAAQQRVATSPKPAVSLAVKAGLPPTLPASQQQPAPVRDVTTAAATLAAQFKAAGATPPDSSSQPSTSTDKNTSSGVYIMPSSSSREPPVTPYTSSGNNRISSAESRGSRGVGTPGTESAHVGTFAGTRPEQHQAQDATVQAMARQLVVTEADVAHWLARCAVLQEKLSGGLMAADGKLQALTARSQLVQGILVSLPHGNKQGKHAHLVPKLQAERARIATESTALKQRLQLLAVAINRLAAARQYLGSQAGTAMSAADRVAILHLVLADVAERLGLWDWEEVQGVAALGDTGQQIRDMLAAAAAAAAATTAPAGHDVSTTTAAAMPPSRPASSPQLSRRQNSQPVMMTAAAAAATPARPASAAEAGRRPAAVSSGANTAVAAAARPAPAKAASWHHPNPQQQQQQQPLYQQWPPYDPSTPAAALAAPKPPAAARAAPGKPAAAAAAGLSQQALQQHNMQQQQGATGRAGPVQHTAAAAAQHRQPAVMPQHYTQQQQQQHTVASHESVPSVEDIAISYAVNSGGKVSPDDALLLQYLGQSESGSGGKTAPSHAGVITSGGNTFVRSRQMQQQQQRGATGGGSMTMHGAAQQQHRQQQQQQQQQQRMDQGKVTGGFGGYRGGSTQQQQQQQQQYEQGYEQMHSDEPGAAGEQEHDPEAALVSDDVWGTVHSIFSTAASNMQTVGYAPSSSSLSFFTQPTEGGVAFASMSGEGRPGSSSSRTGAGSSAAAAAAAAAQARKNRAAMLAESLTAAQLLVQHDDSSSRDVLSTCFQALQQLAAASSSAENVQAAAAAGEGLLGLKQQRGASQRSSLDAVPEAAAVEDEVDTDIWQSASSDSHILDRDESNSRKNGSDNVAGTAGRSISLAQLAAAGQPAAAAAGRPKSPPATASRHVHTFDDDDDDDLRLRQQRFGFGQQQQQEPDVQESAPWSRWASGTTNISHGATAAGGGVSSSASSSDKQQSATAAALEPAGSSISASTPVVAAAFGRRSSTGSSGGGSSDVGLALQGSGPSLTVRDLVQMLSTALQASGPSEDLASLPVAELLLRQQQQLQQREQQEQQPPQQ